MLWRALSWLLAILSAALLCRPLMATPMAVRSGQYDALTLVVAGHQVSGAFSDHRGENGSGGAPQFTCAFLLHGTLDGDRAKVETWTPGDKRRIAGNLTFEGDDVVLQLQEHQAGCAATSGDMVRTPYKLSRTMDGAGWLGVALVSAQRAFIRAAPRGSISRRPYLVEFDPVAVLQRAGEWVRVAYPRGGSSVRGWLRTTELAR